MSARRVYEIVLIVKKKCTFVINFQIAPTIFGNLKIKTTKFNVLVIRVGKAAVSEAPCLRLSTSWTLGISGGSNRTRL